ncbi:MAG: type II secretion system protein GspG, partial [Thermoguttaceae bacterium]|nr:type II secretion system protein GspG [Thermoguttaceae bacterium]
MKRVAKLSTHKSGFTLLELLIVLAILIVVIGMLGTTVWGQYRKALIRTARVQVTDKLHNALELFYVDFGRYPTAEEGLYILANVDNPDPQGSIQKQNQALPGSAYVGYGNQPATGSVAPNGGLAQPYGANNPSGGFDQPFGANNPGGGFDQPFGGGNSAGGFQQTGVNGQYNQNFEGGQQFDQTGGGNFGNDPFNQNGGAGQFDPNGNGNFNDPYLQNGGSGQINPNTNMPNVDAQNNTQITKPRRPKIDEPYIKEQDLKDPWNQPYRYEWPTTKGDGKSPAVWSCGPDKEDNNGEGDDVISWDPEDTSGVARYQNMINRANNQPGAIGNPNGGTDPGFGNPNGGIDPGFGNPNGGMDPGFGNP